MRSFVVPVTADRENQGGRESRDKGGVCVAWQGGGGRGKEVMQGWGEREKERIRRRRGRGRGLRFKG
jgi:hypothetical protein